jgi:hypothetical protein
METNYVTVTLNKPMLSQGRRLLKELKFEKCEIAALLIPLADEPVLI